MTKQQITFPLGTMVWITPTYSAYFGLIGRIADRQQLSGAFPVQFTTSQLRKALEPSRVDGRKPVYFWPTEMEAL